MKTFLITISIIGAIIYGMLEINEYYENRGACSWDFTGVEYRHKERLDNTLNGLMNDIIKRDKRDRKAFLLKKGYSDENITKTIKALEPQYDRERKKMFEYCSFNTEIIRQKKMKYNEFIKSKIEEVSIEVTPSKYCKISNMNNYDDNGYIGVNTKYIFDDESLDFFNPVSYIVERSNKSFYTARFSGIVYHTAYNSCDTRYQGLGETGRFLAKKSDIDIRKIEKKKFIEYLKESTNVKR